MQPTRILKKNHIQQPQTAQKLFFWATTVYATAVWATLVWLLPSNYSPDSWAYYGLAQTLWSDTYALQHYRAYSTDAYSAAFPPLWPFAIATLGAGMGFLAGHALAATSWWACTVGWEWFGQTRYGQQGWGLILGTSLLAQPAYINEVAAGRAIPLAIAVMTLLVGALLSYHRSPTLWKAAGLGAVTGLLVMARFDALLWMIPITLYTAFRSKSIQHLVVLGAAYGVAISPWMGISLVRFSTLFFTDNSWVATALRPGAFVTDWPADGGGHLFDRPDLAIKRVVGHIPVVGRGALDAITLIGLVPLGLVIGTLLVYRARIGTNMLAIGTVLAAGFGLSIAPMLLTGYDDSRYFAALWAFVFWWFWWAMQTTPKMRAIVLAVLALMVFPSFEEQKEGGMPTKRDLHVLSCIDPNGTTLFTDATEGARVSVLYGARTGFVPRNLLLGRNDEDIEKAFIERYNVTTLVDGQNRIMEDSAFADLTICTD